jgi:hypothetical protein
MEVWGPAVTKKLTSVKNYNIADPECGYYYCSEPMMIRFSQLPPPPLEQVYRWRSNDYVVHIGQRKCRSLRRHGHFAYTHDQNYVNALTCTYFRDREKYNSVPYWMYALFCAHPRTKPDPQKHAVLDAKLKDIMLDSYRFPDSVYDTVYHLLLVYFMEVEAYVTRTK